MWSAICRGAGVGPAAARASGEVEPASGDVSGRGVEFERAVEIGTADAPGSADADRREASALDPGPHGRGMQFQLVADLLHGQPGIFSRW